MKVIAKNTNEEDEVGWLVGFFFMAYQPLYVI